MTQWFTVQFVKPTGFTDNYGNESYNVKFVEELDAALMSINPSKSQPPQQGDKIYGTVEERTAKSGKPYRKFTRENPEEPGQTSSVQHKTYSGKQNDKEDVIMQGRCYNNAATLVAAQIGHSSSDEQIATKVQAVATAIYNLPPLQKWDTPKDTSKEQVYVPTDDDMSGPIDLSAVDDMFPGRVELDMKR